MDNIRLGGFIRGRPFYVQSLMTCDRAVLVMRTSGEQKRQKVQ